MPSPTSSRTSLPRRGALATGGALLVTGIASLAGLRSLAIPAYAGRVVATPTMRGGANNYQPGAAIVDRIGGGGFLMTGTVHRAGDGAPLPGRRIQVWAHTTEGHEREERSHGATLSRDDGSFDIEMPQIVPAFGQPHGHLAYDAEYDDLDGNFQTVFLRPIMASSSDQTMHVDFVLQPV